MPSSCDRSGDGTVYDEPDVAVALEAQFPLCRPLSSETPTCCLFLLNHLASIATQGRGNDWPHCLSISDYREEATSAENQCNNDLQDFPQKGIDSLDVSRIKLVECVEGYRESLIDSIAVPHKWLNTGFEIGSTISIEPSTSLSDLILNPDIFSAINELFKTKRELKYLSENILPSTGTKISVWETGKKAEFKEQL